MVLLRVRGDGRVYVPSLPVECSISIESGGLSIECRSVILKLLFKSKKSKVLSIVGLLFVVFLCESDWNVTVEK